jgi:hypothetical protein
MAPAEPAQQPARAEPDWKAEARKWEQRAKENYAAAKRLAEIEEAQKTEAQKLADQLKAAQQEAAAARTEALRLKVAQSKGLSAALAARLQGVTEDEMAADADALLAALPQQPQSISTRPVEALKPGALPASEPATVDPNEWMRQRASRS